MGVEDLMPLMKKKRNKKNGRQCSAGVGVHGVSHVRIPPFLEESMPWISDDEKEKYRRMHACAQGTTPDTCKELGCQWYPAPHNAKEQCKKAGKNIHQCINSGEVKIDGLHRFEQGYLCKWPK